MVSYAHPIKDKTMNVEQTRRAEQFHNLHAGPAPLILPNAWDAASARVIEAAGAPVIATTSGGMAWSLGYRDGEQMSVEELLAAVRRICRVVSVPVTVDIERGYGDDAQATGALVGALIEIGVIGINIEDGVAPGTSDLNAPAQLAERIACARAIARQHDVPFFINARIDTYLAGLPAATRFEETLRRALAYIDAGADGIFVPGMADLEEIEQLAALLPVPLNVYVGYPNAPSATALQQRGVRRISLGCGTTQAMLGQLRQIATEALAEGRYDTMSATMVSVSEANALFATVVAGREVPTRHAQATGTAGR